MSSSYHTRVVELRKQAENLGLQGLALNGRVMVQIEGKRFEGTFRGIDALNRVLVQVKGETSNRRVHPDNVEVPKKRVVG